MVPSLLSLFQSILVPILSEWINGEDICCLDTAVVNEHRQYILSTLAKCFIAKTDFSTDKFYDWVLLRGINLRNVNGYISEKLQLIINKAKHFSYVDSSICTDVTKAFSGFNISVDTLQIGCYNSAQEIEGTLRSISQLRHLDLTLCYNLNEDLELLLTKWSPNLESISLPCVRNSNFLASLKSNLIHFKCRELQDPEESKGKSRYNCQLSSTASICDSDIVISGVSFQLKGLDICEKFSVADALYLQSFLGSVLRVSIPNYNGCQFGPQFMSKFVSLTHFSTRYSIDESDLLVLFSHSRFLRNIEFKYCFVPSSIVSIVTAYCPLLERFILDDTACVVECDLAEMLNRCPHLMEMSVGMFGLEVETVLPFLVNFDSIILSNVRPSNYLLDSSNRQRGLIYSTFYLSCKSFPIIFKGNPTLLRIEIESLNVDFETIDSLVKCCPLIESVQVSDIEELVGKSLMPLIHCKRLTELTVKGSVLLRLTETFMEQMLQNNPGFVKIALGNCRGFSSAVLPKIVRYCPLIRHLSLWFFEVIKPASISELSIGCKNLVFLQLNHRSIPLNR